MIDLDLEFVIKAMVIPWATWVTASIYKAQKDIDFAHYKIRNGNGMRAQSVFGKFKRVFHKKRKDEKDDGTNGAK